MRRRSLLLALLVILTALPGAASNEILRFQLKEGTRVFIRELPTPSAFFTLWSRGGSASESDPGTALLMARVLNRTLRDRLEARGLDLSPTVCITADYSFLSLPISSQSIDPTLVALGETLRAPDFTIFEPEKARLAAELAREKKAPLRIAYQQWLSRVFPNHPYGHAPESNPASLTLEKLKAFYQKAYGAAALSLVEAGGVSSGNLVGTLAYAFSGLPQATGSVPIPNVAPQNGNLAYTLEGATASAAVLGTSGPDISQFRQGVTMDILARMLQHQLEHAQVWWDYRQGPGTFAIAIQGNRQEVDETINQALIAIENIRNGSILPLELSKAQDEFLATLESFKQDPTLLSREIGLFATLGNLTGLDTCAPIIRQINTADIQEAALRYLGPPRMVLVKVYKK